MNRCIALLMTVLSMHVLASEDYDAMRDRMIDEVQADMRRSARYTGISKLSEPVAAALGRVARHEFVPESVRDRAYVNAPQPIGEGQTISQPFIVGLMTELLRVDSDARVLELGTGSGYQAAVLAELVAEVYTIEIVASLGRAAERLLQRLGYDNVSVRVGDGTRGWPEAAPFDGIIVTAAGISIPESLLEQLRPGGRLVMPVGGQYEVQQLMVVQREDDGSFTERQTIPVRFVPITGDNDY